MSGFTPGPWAYRPDVLDDWGIVRAPVTEQGRFLGGIICQARDPEALDALTLASHREKKTDPWEANARLIAAAPELLEALEETWRVLRAAGLLNLTNGVQLGQTSWYVKICDAERLSDAAILKATGQSVVQSENGGGV